MAADAGVSLGVVVAGILIHLTRKVGLTPWSALLLFLSYYGEPGGCLKNRLILRWMQYLPILIWNK